MSYPEIKLDAGMYEEARKQGVTFTEYLARLEREVGYEPPRGSQLDAFERQLARWGIVVKGPQASLVEAFYQTYESSVLFPEFINRQVRMGFQLGQNELKVEDLVATTSQIDAAAYRSLKVNDEGEPEEILRVGEFGEFPATTLTYQENEIKLIKFGRRLQASYEVLRRTKVDLLAVHLRLLGLKMRRAMARWGLEVLINGDGNANPAPTVGASSPDTLTYADLVGLFLEIQDDGYDPTHWVVDLTQAKAILTMTEFKDPQAGFNFQRTGEMISPLGVTLRLFKYAPKNRVVEWDQKAALELVEEAGGQLVDSDRVISRQFEEIVISHVAGFAKIYPEAARVLVIS